MSYVPSLRGSVRWHFGYIVFYGLARRGLYAKVQAASTASLVSYIPAMGCFPAHWATSGASSSTCSPSRDREAYYPVLSRTSANGGFAGQTGSSLHAPSVDGGSSRRYRSIPGSGNLAAAVQYSQSRNIHIA